MSRLEDLIAELCPDGVEYKPLGAIVEIKRGDRVTKRDLLPSGEYKVISGGERPLGYLNKYNRNENTITIAQYGSAGFVDFQRDKFWANDVCYSIIPTNLVINKYLYYCLMNKQSYLYEIRTDAIPAHLPIDKLKAVIIPVPPLAIQEEIVRILDAFTELKAELNTELKARKEQYEYYRDQLFNFATPIYSTISKHFAKLSPDVVNYKIVKDVISSLTTGLNPRNYFVLNEDGYNKYYITAKDIFDNNIHPSGNTALISSEIVQLINKRANLGDDIILFSSTGSGTVGRMAYVSKYLGDWSISETMYVIKADSSQIISKYLMYALMTNAVINQYKPKISSGTVPHLKISDFLKISIPVPSITIQKEIVCILDMFTEMLTKLMADINAREKQYEYYRDQLLTFKPKETTA